jgi:parallel beta-helix repeat protein
MSRTLLLVLALLFLSSAAYAADVSVALNTADRVVTGGLYPVTVSLHNAGPDAAVGARVRIEVTDRRFVPLDKYPSCLVDGDAILCYAYDFAAGETRDFALTFTAHDSATPIAIHATAVTTNDSNPANDSASATVNVFAAVDLNLSVDIYPSLQPRQQSQVRFDVRNLSSTPAGPFSGVYTFPSTLTVTSFPDHCDKLDSANYRCDFAGLSFGIVAAAFQVVPDAGIHSATLSGSVDYNGDANPSDNRVTLDAPVYDVAQLALSITSPDRLDDSRTGAIRYHIENTADVAANDVVIETYAGSNATVASFTADGWACAPRSEPGLRCTTVAPHEARDIVLNVTFPKREWRTQFFAIASMATPAAFRALPNNKSADGIFYRVFDVTNVFDEGAGSLRSAIDAANAQCGNDQVNIPCRIAFEIPGTIAPRSPLPIVTAPDFAIDGEAQTTFIDGSLAGDADGLHINSTIAIVRGLAIGNFARNGILLERGTAQVPTLNQDQRIEQNFLTGNGLRGVMALRFRGTIAANVIGGNARSAIFLYPATDTTIRDNRLGVAAADDSPLPNGASGIFIGPQSNNITIENNVIANNSDFGIAVARPVTIAIGANRFLNSGQRAIDVGLDGPSPSEQNAPVPTVLSARYDAASGDTIIEGSGVRRAYPLRETLYLYANSADVAEGNRFLGSTTVDGSAHFVFSVHEDLRGMFVAAAGVIHTDFGDIAWRNSTELSERLRVN